MILEPINQNHETHEQNQYLRLNFNKLNLPHLGFSPKSAPEGVAWGGLRMIAWSRGGALT